MATYTLKTHGGKLIRHFWCPDAGGYVYETSAERPGSSGRQINARLEYTGNTLRVPFGDALKCAIQAARRREIRDEKRMGFKVTDYYVSP